MEKMEDVLSKKLSETRKSKGWTQEEFAKNIGISRSYFAKLENGNSVPSMKVLIRIEKVVPIFFLLKMTLIEERGDLFGTT